MFEDKTKILNGQRALITTETNEMIKTCTEFQTAAAWQDGTVQATQTSGQGLSRGCTTPCSSRARGAAAYSFADVVAGGRDDAGALPLPSEPLSVRRPYQCFDYSRVMQGRPGPAAQPQHIACSSGFQTCDFKHAIFFTCACFLGATCILL